MKHRLDSRDLAGFRMTESLYPAWRRRERSMNNGADIGLQEERRSL
jgi:hypothetical protein